MKNIIFLTFFGLFFSCSSDSTDKPIPSTPEEILAEMSEIESQIESITSTSCSSTSSCQYRPLGVKACGGPTHYIVYGSVTSELELQNLITRYNKLNQAYNDLTGAVSDCSLENPPNLECISGKCEPVTN